MPNFGLNEKDDPCLEVLCEKCRWHSTGSTAVFFAVIIHFSTSKTVTKHEINSWWERQKKSYDEIYKNVKTNIPKIWLMPANLPFLESIEQLLSCYQFRCSLPSCPDIVHNQITFRWKDLLFWGSGTDLDSKAKPQSLPQLFCLWVTSLKCPQHF